MGETKEHELSEAQQGLVNDLTERFKEVLISEFHLHDEQTLRALLKRRYQTLLNSRFRKGLLALSDRTGVTQAVEPRSHKK